MFAIFNWLNVTKYLFFKWYLISFSSTQICFLSIQPKNFTVVDYDLLYGYLRTIKTFYPSRAPGCIHVTHLVICLCCVFCYVSDAVLHIQPSVDLNAGVHKQATGSLLMNAWQENNAGYKSVIRSCKNRKMADNTKKKDKTTNNGGQHTRK